RPPPHSRPSAAHHPREPASLLLSASPPFHSAAGVTATGNIGQRRRRSAADIEEGAVGSLIYGTSGIEISFDDRVLAHLELVINAKLRRRESFMLSWRDSPGVGD